MFLITFDIIDSRKQDLKLIDIPNINDYLNTTREYYNINPENIQINDGDQIRILVLSHINIIEIIFDVLSFLISNDMRSRVFISLGDISTVKYSHLSEADGEIFYKNKILEETSKANLSYYKDKYCSIRYTGGEYSSILDILLLGVSKLCLKKGENIPVLFKRIYKDLNQSQLAEEFSISQNAVSKKLKSNEFNYLKSAIIEINKILKEEENNAI